jgi:hypothetical protein
VIDFGKYVDVSSTSEKLSSIDHDSKKVMTSFGKFTMQSAKDPSLLSEAYSSLADEAEANNHHLVMCHEIMHALPGHYPNYLSTLAAATSRFEVTIVTTYRESLSLYISKYNAHAIERLKHESLISSLTHFTSHIEDTNTHSLQTEAIEWKSHFKDVVVMDYYGILAANQSIQRVFFCEIMEMKGFCDYDFTQNRVANPAAAKEYTNKLAGVQRAFLKYAAEQCQKLPPNAYTPMYLETMEKAYQKAKSPAIPVKTSTPTDDSKKRLHELMVADFDIIGSMKYKNITANTDALDKASTYDVDGPAIKNDESFINMFKGLLKKNGHPGDCREIRKFTIKSLQSLHTL